LIKTGEVFERDEEGLWLCESWEDETTGEVHTTRNIVEATDKTEF
jgi:hypothetical protein